MTTPNQPNDGHQNNGVTERIAPSPIPPRPAPRPGSAESGPQGGNTPGGQSHEKPQQQGGFGAQQGGAQQSGKAAPDSKPGFDQETARIGGGSGEPKGGPEAGKDSAPAGGKPQNGQSQNGQPQNAPAPGAPGQGGPGQGPGGPQQGGPAQGAGGQNPGGQNQFQEGWSQLPQREPQSNLYRPGQSPVTGRPGSGGGLGGGLGSGGLGGASNARTTADLAAKAARKEAAMVKSVGIDGPTRSIARPELIKDMPDLSEIRHPLPPADKAAPGTSPQSPLPTAVPVAMAAAVSAGDPLRATVQIRRIDPWSTLKISLVISVALFFVWMLAVGLLYIVLEGMGVWERLNNTFTEMVSQDGGTSGLIDAGTVFGYAGVIGLINVVLFTALGTVGTFIYNQCCDLVGGIQVTLADPD
ncbi:DUF3566 domain-containing protein [Nocardia higoensis]|uniref:DUF3566 domain-containing protein n=1 Tax=Nocardia higoensis TaxID=228599 RepID=A0ABS0DFZ7_9NOCA|nr:DUF3566 domain-containing protein [Nocardia higoensis]MBF6356778.1 DUF3566 domain-containing protein [Nocardia higoensis]